MKSSIFNRVYIIVVILVTLWFFCLAAIIRSYENEKEAYLDSEALLIESTIQSSTKTYEDLSSFVFKQLLNRPEIKALLSSAYKQDEATQKQIRAELYRLLKEDYAILRGYNYGQLQFHFPNGDSFLRFSDPSIYGDNLFSIRPTIHIANIDKRYVFGYEAGRVFDGLRFVYPLSYQNKHIGSVELGVSLYGSIKSVNNLFPGNNVVYIIRKELVERIMVPNYMDDYSVSFVSDDYMIEKNIFQKMLQSNNASIPYDNPAFVDKLKAGAQNKIGQNTRFSFYVCFQEKYYLVHFLPIDDALHNMAGYYISIYEDDHIPAVNAKEVMTLSLITLMAAVLVASSMIYSRDRKKMFHIAITDSLTHIYSRRYFYAVAEKELSRSLRHHLRFCLLLLDIDHFKYVNDTYGHPIGDLTLEHLANTVTENLRESDIFARWGGEEFILLMPETDASSGLEAAERLRRIIENQSFHSAGSITVSIGVSAFDGTDTTIDAIINRADQALYKAKQEGRNRVCASDLPQFCG